MTHARARRLVATIAAVVGLMALLVPGGAVADGTTPQEPGLDPFYTWDGPKPLASYAPGSVLKTRSTRLHIASIKTPVAMTQLLYRTTGQRGEATQTVVSVLQPPVRKGPVRVLSIGSAYDSTSQRCQPSFVYAGGADQGLLTAGESALMALYLLQGYTVLVADFEGQNPNFGIGRPAGLATLDSIRAAFRSPDAKIPANAKVGLLGYSGGAIGAEWAAELAPTYAPDVNARLVGVAAGGLFVNPIHNLRYVEGSKFWTGVIPMVLIGISRAFDFDIDPYVSDFGGSVASIAGDKCIIQMNGHYPGLEWADLVQPRYAQVEKFKPFVEIANQMIMGTGGTPTVPMLIRQGKGGPAEGTRPSKLYGDGDGVMLAADARTLARQYCAAGIRVDYAENRLSHIAVAGQFLLADAPGWLADRFAGKPARNTCSAIKPGNSIAPIEVR